MFLLQPPVTQISTRPPDELVRAVKSWRCRQQLLMLDTFECSGSTSKISTINSCCLAPPRRSPTESYKYACLECVYRYTQKVANASQYALLPEFNPTKTVIALEFVGPRDSSGLEEVTILPSAWRLRTRHESQKTPKEDMLPVPILFWLVPFIDSPRSQNKGSPKSQSKLRRQIRTMEITGFL